MAPLLGIGEDEVLNSIVDAGFEAYVVRIGDRHLPETWVGRVINKKFISDIKKKRDEYGINILGEAGGGHTFVEDGPIFKKRIKIIEAHRLAPRAEYGDVLYINKCKLIPKKDTAGIGQN